MAALTKAIQFQKCKNLDMSIEDSKTDKPFTLQNVTVRDYSMILHMNYKSVHSSKHKGTFVCEGSSLHDKEFIHESHTEIKGFMEYGDTKTAFYLNEDSSPNFDTIQELVKHYHAR